MCVCVGSGHIFFIITFVEFPFQEVKEKDGVSLSSGNTSSITLHLCLCVSLAFSVMSSDACLLLHQRVSTEVTAMWRPQR